MTAEWFDLGQRLRAAHSGHPVPRLLHAPLASVLHPVAVRAHRRGDQVTVAATSPGRRPRTATGPAALDLLGSLGATLAAPSPATLITDDPATLGNLHRLALTAAPDSDADTVAAHIAWWRDRADYPAGRAVVDTLAACRTRWTLGTDPAAEHHLGPWRAWLGIPDDSVTGLLDLHTLLTAGPPLPWLDVLAEDDVWSYGPAQSEHSDGLDWRRPDSTSRAALGLRSRCDAADLYAAALLSDPIYRRRAVHTGHVVTGTAKPLGDKLKRVEVTCTRLDSRLRPGNALTGWVGGPATSAAPFTASVSAATVRAGNLILTLSGTTGAAPGEGDPVTLTTAPPSPHRQRAGRKTYRALYSARRSWLTTGRTPTATRRPVPLDVLVAGAEPH
jgi:hypothetical protein